MTWCIEYRVECVLLLIHSCTSVCSITWFESTRHSYILPYPCLHYHCFTLIDKSWIIMWRPGCNWGEDLWSNHTEHIFINLLQFSFSVYIHMYLKAYSSSLAVTKACSVWPHAWCLNGCLPEKQAVGAKLRVPIWPYHTQFSFCLTKVKACSAQYLDGWTPGNSKCYLYLKLFSPLCF